MKNRDIQMTLDAMRETAERRFPEKETPQEQFAAYGKIGLIIYLQKRGYGYGDYLDALARVSI